MRFTNRLALMLFGAALALTACDNKKPDAEEASKKVKVKTMRKEKTATKKPTKQPTVEAVDQPNDEPEAEPKKSPASDGTDEPLEDTDTGDIE